MPRAARRLVPARAGAGRGQRAQHRHRVQLHALLPARSDPVHAVRDLPARQQAQVRLPLAHLRHVGQERLRGVAAVLLEHRREHGRDTHAEDIHQARRAAGRGVPLPRAQVQRRDGRRVPAARPHRPGQPLVRGHQAPAAIALARLERGGERAGGLGRQLLPRPVHQDRAHLADQPAARRGGRVQRRHVVLLHARAHLPDAAGSHRRPGAHSLPHPAAGDAHRHAAERARLRLVGDRAGLQLRAPDARERAALQFLPVDLDAAAPQLRLRDAQGRLLLHGLPPGRERRGRGRRAGLGADLERGRGPLLRPPDHPRPAGPSTRPSSRTSTTSTSRSATRAACPTSPPRRRTSTSPPSSPRTASWAATAWATRTRSRSGSPRA